MESISDSAMNHCPMTIYGGCHKVPSHFQTLSHPLRGLFHSFWYGNKLKPTTHLPTLPAHPEKVEKGVRGLEMARHLKSLTIYHHGTVSNAETGFLAESELDSI